MSKKKSIKKPATVGPTFSDVHQEMLDWINTLQSVVLAMDSSPGIDGCEVGSQARNATRLCAKNLHALAYQLETTVSHG